MFGDAGHCRWSILGNAHFGSSSKGEDYCCVEESSVTAFMLIAKTFSGSLVTVLLSTDSLSCFLAPLHPFLSEDSVHGEDEIVCLP